MPDRRDATQPKDLDFSALRKQAAFIEQPDARIGKADLGYTACLLRWAADHIEEGCAACNEIGESYL